MGAIASREARRRVSECASSPRIGPGIYGAFGLLAAYIVVLTFGLLENPSIEKFEATMNVVAIAGFVIPFAAFWSFDRQHLALNSENEQLRQDLGQNAVATSRDRRVMSNAGSRWGPPSVVGFPEE